VSFDESVVLWAGRIGVLLTVLAALVGTLFFFFSNRVSKAKDMQLATFQQESKGAIASADARAAEANRAAAEAVHGTAKAMSDAAGANERSRQIELDAAAQRERAAKAERELLELQQRLAARTLSDAGARTIVSRLAPFHGQHMRLFVVSGNEEVDQFSRQLQTAFETGGLVVDRMDGQQFGVARSGLFIIMGENRRALADALAAAFHDARLIAASMPAAKSAVPDDLVLEIWPK
jgi:hypothetical protein